MVQKQGNGTEQAFNPHWGAAEQSAAQELLRLALAEDLNCIGDLTSTALLPDRLLGRAAFVARSSGVVAGLPILQMVFATLDPNLAVRLLTSEGSAVEMGAKLAAIEGKMRPMLTGERTALNFLQRLSGVATLTRSYVEAIAGWPCLILDTRKTTPGWRRLEKYAVRCGGGRNQRLGLFDGVLIKDNHLAALHEQADPIGYAVQTARNQLASTVPLEVEVETLPQLERALAAQPDIILLDNMDLETLRQAVRCRNEVAPGIKLEASGSVSLATVRPIAETGVDFISVGALTHSAVALDMAMDYE